MQILLFCINNFNLMSTIYMFWENKEVKKKPDGKTFSFSDMEKN